MKHSSALDFQHNDQQNLTMYITDQNQPAHSSGKMVICENERREVESAASPYSAHKKETFTDVAADRK